MSFEKTDADNRFRAPFINRPTKGKTARKRKYPPRGVKTNVGDPNERGKKA